MKEETKQHEKDNARNSKELEGHARRLKYTEMKGSLGIWTQHELIWIKWSEIGTTEVNMKGKSCIHCRKKTKTTYVDLAIRPRKFRTSKSGKDTLAHRAVQLDLLSHWGHGQNSKRLWPFNLTTSTTRVEGWRKQRSIKQVEGSTQHPGGTPSTITNITHSPTCQQELQGERKPPMKSVRLQSGKHHKRLENSRNTSGTLCQLQAGASWCPPCSNKRKDRQNCASIVTNSSIIFSTKVIPILRIFAPLPPFPLFLGLVVGKNASILEHYYRK